MEYSAAQFQKWNSSEISKQAGGREEAIVDKIKENVNNLDKWKSHLVANAFGKER